MANALKQIRELHEKELKLAREVTGFAGPGGTSQNMGGP